MLDEKVASHCQQLTFSRMVDGLPSDDLFEKCCSMLPDVVSKARLRRVRSNHKHVSDAS